MKVIKATIWVRDDVYDKIEKMEGVIEMDWLDSNEDDEL